MVLTGDEDLKPQLRSRLEALGIAVGDDGERGGARGAWGGGAGVLYWVIVRVVKK